ncbi:hypothetical protein GUJ93_ZPchr0011g27646 [Zizania palustris]|uniref:Uncharacterized protein n=1 Tax=Zizania palustris TaxID=103762 RepID=A0A8J5WEX0_ZIZPA|nr:hypothetical protein GUJ93_ZPchr0011g27646 [Zizania palustris]
MEEVAQLSVMKCSATVDAARDTVSAARDTGDLCVKQSLGNDVVESVLNVKKKAICALNQARAAAVCAEDSLAYSRQETVFFHPTPYKISKSTSSSPSRVFSSPVEPPPAARRPPPAVRQSLGRCHRKRGSG